MPKSDRRFPAAVYGHGSEPDARFSLANERTFLAWISTALALISIGVALDALVPGLHPTLRKTSAVIFIVAGLASPVQAWIGWFRVENALRENKSLPAPVLLPWITGAVAIAGILILLGVVRP